MGRTCVFWFAVLGASVAAEELLTPGEEVLRALEATEEGRREYVELLREASELYRYPASAEEAEALFAAAARATRSKNPAVRLAAVRAISSMGGPKAAAIIEPFLRESSPKPEERPALLTAIQAAGRLHVPSLIPSLLTLAKSGKDPTIADQALLALGQFHKLPLRERKALVEKALALTKSMSRSRRRWNRMRAPGLRCLQMLTGQKLNSVDLFTEWWKVAKDRKDPFAP